MLRKIIDVESFQGEVFRLTVEYEIGGMLPGQVFNLGLPSLGVNREYSMCCFGEGYLSFLVKKVGGGVVSPVLADLVRGDLVQVHGPYGEFTIRESWKDRRHIFVGTGTGVAPFRSFLDAFSLECTVLHGTRYIREDYGQKLFANTNYVQCVSRESPPNAGLFFEGRVTDYCKHMSFNRDDVVYLCGNRRMIAEMLGILRDKGINDVVTETFF